MSDFWLKPIKSFQYKNKMFAGISAHTRWKSRSDGGSGLVQSKHTCACTCYTWYKEIRLDVHKYELKNGILFSQWKLPQARNNYCPVYLRMELSPFIAWEDNSHNFQIFSRSPWLHNFNRETQEKKLHQHYSLYFYDANKEIAGVVFILFEEKKRLLAIHIFFTSLKIIEYKL